MWRGAAWLAAATRCRRDFAGAARTPELVQNDSVLAGVAGLAGPAGLLAGLACSNPGQAAPSPDNRNGVQPGDSLALVPPTKAVENGVPAAAVPAALSGDTEGEQSKPFLHSGPRLMSFAFPAIILWRLPRRYRGAGAQGCEPAEICRL
eukprot:SAG31_NODE_26081_length_448_cov_64.739255_1_plen_148_part_10